MKRYYSIAFAEAFYLVQNRVVLSALHCLFAACVIMPCYALFQLSLAVGMFPLWVSGRLRSALTDAAESAPLRDENGPMPGTRDIY